MDDVHVRTVVYEWCRNYTHCIQQVVWSPAQRCVRFKVIQESLLPTQQTTICVQPSSGCPLAMLLDSFFSLPSD